MAYIKNGGSFAGVSSKKKPEDEVWEGSKAGVNSTRTGTGLAQSYGQPQGAGAGDLGGGNGRFINFSRYLNQNQAGANQMANSLGGAADAKALAAGKAIRDQAQGFKQAADAGTVKYDASRQVMPVAPVYASGTVTDSPNLQTKKQGLQSQAPGTYNRAELEAGANATYSGPKSLMETQGYQGVSDSVDKANTAVNSLQSFEGIQSNLQDEYAKQGSYTQGDSLFDAALAQNAGAGKFAAMKKKFGGLSNALTSAQQNATAYANKAAGTSAQNAGVFRDLASKYDAAQAQAEKEAAAASAAASAKAADDAATAQREENIASNDEVVQINAARQADLDGLTTAWENAGKPLPYDAWKEAYMAGKA